MPVHDWTRVSHGIFHDFHYSWILEIKRALKGGLLSDRFYVMAEQIVGDIGGIPDIVRLRVSKGEPYHVGPLPATAALADLPPAVQVRATIPRDTYARLQRTLVIRHSSDDHIVAMIEVLSPSIESSQPAMRSLLDKLVAALHRGIHLLLVEVHPPGPRESNGIHGAILHEIGRGDYRIQGELPLTVVSYIGGAVVDAFVDHFAIGQPIPKMPLFLTPENYVSVPLEQTYMAAWQDVPAQYQEILAATTH